MSSMRQQSVRLSSGYTMPLVGIGTFRITGRDVINEVIDESLRVGFRAIDTAAVYKNEEDIGHALKVLVPKYGLKRDDIFITTKLAPSCNGYAEDIENAVLKSLKNLQLNFIDLYLIHWPGAAGIHEKSIENKNLRIRTWQKLIQLQRQGWIRSIGVSNYTINHLKELLRECDGIIPDVNQVECHPHYQQEELRKYCNTKGIHVQAYSSLGTSDNNHLLTDSTVIKIALELNVSAARLLLKWALQQGVSVIPKAVKKEHIRDNMKLEFVIDEKQMKVLSHLQQRKYAWDPKNVY